MRTKNPLSRRTILRGAAGAALALPFLDAMRTSTSAQVTVPKRFVVWYTPNGFQASDYPTSMDFAGTSFAPLARHAADLIAIRGLAMRSAAGQSSADHPSGFGHMLTGNLCEISSDDILRATSPSIDQFLARRMGLTRTESSLHGITSHRTMSYGADGTPVRPEDNPAAAFDRIFRDVMPSAAPEEPAADASAAVIRRGSIIDAVRGSYEELRCRLGGEDRRRIEQHLEQIRGLERRLEAFAPGGGGGVGGSCTVPMLGSAADDRNVGRLHSEILANALGCDLTRVGTIQWYSHTGTYGNPYDWGGLRSHHEASHSNDHGGHDEEFASELASFLDLLGDTPAEDGMPLLHHTAVLCVSELGLNSDLHHLSDLGILVAGQAGGALRTGRYIDYLAGQRGGFVRSPDWMRQHNPGQYFEDFDVPHNKLLVELINAVSPDELEPVTDFGVNGLGRGGLPELRA